MRRATVTNVNDGPYWDGVYEFEELSQKVRVDELRAVALNRWVRIREEELQRGVRILDVGCGLGDALVNLRRFNPLREFTGLDISWKAIEYNQRIFGTDGENWGTWLAGDICGEHPPHGLRQLSYDVVWCGETLEHLEDPDRALTRMSQLVEPGGFIIISTPFKQRNISHEHVWEFEPADISRWATTIIGELVFLDCCLLPGWLTMFAVFRVGKAT